MWFFSFLSLRKLGVSAYWQFRSSPGTFLMLILDSWAWLTFKLLLLLLLLLYLSGKLSQVGKSVLLSYKGRLKKALDFFSWTWHSQRTNVYRFLLFVFPPLLRNQQEHVILWTAIYTHFGRVSKGIFKLYLFVAHLGWNIRFRATAKPWSLFQDVGGKSQSELKGKKENPGYNYYEL